MRGRGPDGRFVKLSATPPEALADLSLTAAVASLPTDRIEEKMPRSAEAWQERAWRLWRILGILNAPTSFKAEQVGRLGWNVIVDGNQLEPEQALEAMEAITTGLGVREAARRIALNLEVVAEVFYARKADEWNVYGPTTPKLKELLKASDIVVRGWQADPEDPNKASSPIQAALNTAESIRLMAALSRSQDRNRLAQRGILLVPKEGQFPDKDPFKSMLEASITAPLTDEYSGSAVVPLVVDYPAEYIEKWRHLLLESPYDDKLMERIEAAVKQFAQEIDMPPEVLLGNMDSNHWNAWLSSEENYRGYVEPLGSMVGEVFADAMMQAVEGKVVTVTPDPVLLLARRASVQDAFEALRLGAVGFAYVRDAIGADDDDAPTPEEVELILRMLGNVPQPFGLLEQGPPQMNGSKSNGNGVTAAVKDDVASLERLARRLTDIDIRLLSLLEGLAGMAVSQVRSKTEDTDIGVTERVAGEMERLGMAWNREVSGARKALRGLGIDAQGPAWDEAQNASVDLLVDTMTVFVTDNLDKTDSAMPALPVLALREVMATAGGSGSAVVAAIKRNPAPTFADPRGFALGVLPLKELKGQDVELVQWRFRYGQAPREHPFEEHKDVDGQFMSADGYTSDGWYPGDHAGCECDMDPVFRVSKSPEDVEEAIDS